MTAQPPQQPCAPNAERLAFLSSAWLEELDRVLAQYRGRRRRRRRRVSHFDGRVLQIVVKDGPTDRPYVWDDKHNALTFTEGHHADPDAELELAPDVLRSYFLGDFGQVETAYFEGEVVASGRRMMWVALGAKTPSPDLFEQVKAFTA